MTALVVLCAAAFVLLVGGRFYSRFIARMIGEDGSRIAPSLARSDGRDYVPTPTPVVFGHHFAAIAGAGPIVGPVVAAIYGWGPALIWVVLGGLLFGAVHDYIALHMAMREGGQSVAVTARRLLGRGPFIAMMLLLIIMLALVCATFLNLSAAALTSMVDNSRLHIQSGGLLRIQDGKVVIGGIASMSVIIITAAAPLIGYMYIKRRIAVWKCSLLATVICGVSILIGLYLPISLPAASQIGPFAVKGIHVWMLLLSAYCLVAAGIPVWIFLQSRDFVNVHMLYVGLGLVMLALIVGSIRVAGGYVPAPADPIKPFAIAEGAAQMHSWLWPGLFTLVACGAISGFHSLCAGGTTCKQLKSESSARTVGYFGMILESLLAVAVICLIILAAGKSGYLQDAHPNLVGSKAMANPPLAFAMTVGNAGQMAFGISPAIGALAGMILLEGFLITTLDAAVRLTRYLIEEVWRTLLLKEHLAADGTSSHIGKLPSLLGHYWFNSGLAVLLMLGFAFSSGIMALWPLFAASNQLLAAMVLSLAALWLLKSGRRVWFVVVPAIFMLITTIASLIMQLMGYISAARKIGNLGQVFANLTSITLLVANTAILILTAYLLVEGIRAAAAFFVHRKARLQPQPELSQVGNE